jgi:hypothetical protein
VFSNKGLVNFYEDSGASQKSVAPDRFYWDNVNTDSNLAPLKYKANHAMSKMTSPATSHVKPWLGVIVATTILFNQAGNDYTANAAQKSLPVRDFLPPVASINAKLLENAEASNDNMLEPVALSAVQGPVLHASPKIKKLDTDLGIHIKTEQLESLLEIQRKVDEADLESLWEATIQKNPVIRFSLEKLATPSDLQTKQSSRFMTKTLNMLISGATMVPAMLPGASMYQNMGSMAMGNALQNMVNGRTQVNVGSLSATEQIQLAGLIDELKLRLIHSYQDYKNTLQNLAQSHQVTVKNNSLYAKALESKNNLAIMASGAAYYQSVLSETTLRQKAKLYRVQLERLAGPEAVNRLELAVHIPENTSTATAATPINSTASYELIGPLPIENALPNNTAKINEMIGPELPPAKIKTSKKTVQNDSSLKKNEFPQPLEIGPQLQESKQIEPLSFSGAASGQNNREKAVR